MRRDTVVCIVMMLSIASCHPTVMRNGREIPIPDCKPIVEYTGTKFTVKGAAILIPKAGEAFKVGEVTWEPQLLQKASGLTQILDNHRISVCQGLKTALGASDSVFDQFLLDFHREEQRLAQLAILIESNKPDAVSKWIDAYEPFAQDFKAERAALVSLDALIKQTNKRLEVNELVNAMLANYNSGQYDYAEDRADEILNLDSNNWRAFNMKGSVAFYKGSYQVAAEYFTKALLFNPGSRIITMNLADTYIELGAIERAKELYRSIGDGKQDWSYAMGRALLYSKSFQESLGYLEGLPTSFKSGAPRIIEASAIAGQAQKETDSKRKAELLNTASNKLRMGIAQDPAYWHGILSGKKRDIHEGYSVPISLLEGIYENTGTK